MERRKFLQSSVGCVFLGAVGNRLVNAQEEEMNKYDQMNRSGWRMSQYDASNSGYNSKGRTIENPDLLWSATTSEGRRSENRGVSVSDGFIYVGAEDVSAVDTDTGEIVWDNYRVNESHTPVVGEENLYISELVGKIKSVNKETGKVEWEYAINEGNWTPNIRSPPTLIDGTVYVGDDNRWVYGVDAETGEEEWSFDARNGVTTTVCVSERGGKVYFGTEEKQIYCVNSETGESIWSKKLEGEEFKYVRINDITFDDNVYLSLDNRGVMCLKSDTGEEIWRVFKAEESNISKLSSDGERVYFRTSKPGSSVRALDAETGEIIWKYEAQETVEELEKWEDEIAVTDGQVIFLTSDFIHGVDSKTGELIWELELLDTPKIPPVVTGSGIYTGDKNRIYRIGEEKAKKGCPNISMGNTHASYGPTVPGGFHLRFSTEIINKGCNSDTVTVEVVIGETVVNSKKIVVNGSESKEFSFNKNPDTDENLRDKEEVSLKIYDDEGKEILDRKVSMSNWYKSKSDLKISCASLEKERVENGVEGKVEFAIRNQSPKVGYIAHLKVGGEVKKSKEGVVGPHLDDAISRCEGKKIEMKHIFKEKGKHRVVVEVESKNGKGDTKTAGIIEIGDDNGTKTENVTERKDENSDSEREVSGDPNQGGDTKMPGFGFVGFLASLPIIYRYRNKLSGGEE